MNNIYTNYPKNLLNIIYSAKNYEDGLVMIVSFKHMKLLKKIIRDIIIIYQR